MALDRCDARGCESEIGRVVGSGEDGGREEWVGFLFEMIRVVNA